MAEAQTPRGETWNNQMYQRHPTPYDAGIAGIIQRARVRQVLKLARLQPSDRVIELGCERGELLASCTAARQLIGGDISSIALGDARQTFTRRGIEASFVQIDLEQPLPFRRGAAEVVICSEVLEHVPDPRRVTRRIAEICLPSTRVVLTVPIEKPKVRIKAWLKAVGLLGLLFPGIEAGQSEWHLHAFDRAMLKEITRGVLRPQTIRAVWGAHLVGLFHADESANG